MGKKGLVSLITPCHNSSKFIHRLLDSVLEQTYGQIEMITVDNASTDDTPKIIKNYIPKFEARGYTLNYIRQEDLGPSAGIQTGLRIITGEFLQMPDSDDWYAGPLSVELFVNKFKELPNDYAIIRCQQSFVDEENMQITGISYKDATEDDPGTLFEDCLFGKNGYNYAPINYMVRVSALRKETGLEIYNAYNTGQQRQICLPLYYKYKAWTIKKPLVCYLVRKSSVSHGDYAKYPTQRELYGRCAKYIDSILEDIDTMSLELKNKYRSAFLLKETERIYGIAKYFGENKDLELFLKKYKEYGGNVSKLRMKYLFVSIKKSLKNFMCVH